MLRTAPAAVIVASALLLTGSHTNATSTTPTPPPAAPTTVAPAYENVALARPAAGSVPIGTTVMIIRHAEKPKGSKEPGVDAAGKKNKHSLTSTGWSRARGLVGMFGKRGLARPTRIYAAGATEEAEGERTRETVQPLAAAIHVPVDTSFVRESEKALAARVATQPGRTLISWQHNGIPDIADAFPGVTPKPPTSWPDGRFDVVWTLTKTATGWHFAQTPEMVLPGDSPNVIGG